MTNEDGALYYFEEAEEKRKISLPLPSAVEYLLRGSPMNMRSALSILLVILTCLVLFACRPSHIHREGKSAVYVKSVEGVPIGK